MSKDHSRNSDNDVISNGEATCDERMLRVTELGENNCEVKLPLNVMSGVSRPFTMRLITWVGKFMISILIFNNRFKLWMKGR